jgi:hypothetical protein
MTQPTPNILYPVANGTTSSLPFIEVFKNRNPSTNDVNYQIQQRWWNTNTNVEYVLVGFISTGGELQANWQAVSTGSIIPVETFTADTGGAVSPIANNINLFSGDGVITTAGDPVSATLTVELTGIVTPAHGGTGVVNPPAHTIPIAEGSSNFNFLGPMMSGQVLIGSTGVDPVVANLTAGAGVMITNGPGSITIASTSSGMGIQTETGNSGGPVGPDGSNNLNVIGDGTTIEVVGTPLTNTLTISTTDTVATTYDANAGSAVPAGGVLHVVGSGNITTTGAGNTITAELTGLTDHSLIIGRTANTFANLGVATNGQLPIGSTGADPVLSTLTAGSNISITNGAGSVTIAAPSVFSSINNQVFTTSGTYTPTAGMLYCYIQCIGGGGAGGGAALTGGGSYSASGGGGGGEYSAGIFSAAEIGASVVTIGAGGTAHSGTTGGAGGTTSVGSLISSGGGSGGGSTGATSILSIAAGGNGGAGGSGGDYRSSGVIGGYGIAAFPLTMSYAGGGASSFLGGGSQINGSSGTPGHAAIGYGTGGGGSANEINTAAQLGGVGASGLVIITEYI